MAPAATSQTSLPEGRSSSPAKRGWTEHRSDIPSILVGRGQENTSTARHELEQSMDSRRKSPDKTQRSRQNSLKRVKNSTDLLRQRSQKQDIKEGAVDGNGNTREGRQFTVANVGNNGKIYLRPTTRAPPKTQIPPPALPLAKSHESDADIDNPNDTKRWSDTQASKTPTGPRRAESFGRSPNSVSRNSVDSISTISASRRLEQGQYKVVINNTTKLPSEQLLPTLEVPIPHYRLGTPRFSTRGTAFLHSQVYSRASTADENDSTVITGPEYDAVFPVPPGMEAHTTLSRRHSHAAPQPHTVQITPSGRIPITTKSPVYHRARQPIAPAIYDTIAANPDDPAIVRYALSSREIQAASPARLIAQITSKNFLDYELLSDFFLTVRAYMSTHDLLAYLLTRFEWAVNRFDDDGRVIRVRAFAAIRHWVLNYFPYDFVVDRDLRVKFCQHLNNLTRQVRQRSSHEPSDLKLIIDLKKCWNGRCALYWDCPTGEADGRYDLDIMPGGIVGSRDSQLTHPSELWAKIAESSSQQIDQAKSVAALHNWVDSVIEAEVEGKREGSERGVSLSTSRSMPIGSPLSELSVPAMSCTIPGKTMKAFAATQAHRNVGPHPVPTTVPPAARRVGPAAPSSHTNEKARSKNEHKRSGSFQDALGDRRTSLPAMNAEQSAEQVVMTFPFSGSLIRGSVLPPGSPFIDNLAPHGSATSLQRQYMDNIGSGRVTVRSTSPAVKNLLGTIRRAIGSKQSPSVPAPTLLSTAPFMVETKDSALPMHIAYKIEGFGDQHHQLEALKKNSRIDLLCADITEMFERAVTQSPLQMMAPISSIGVASGNEREQPSPNPPQSISTPDREALQRSHSEMTYGSQSIVIVDDTASEQPPVPAVPSEFHHQSQEYSFQSSNPPYPMTDLATSTLPATTFQPSAAAYTMSEATEGETSQSVLLPPFTIPPMSGALAAVPTSSPANQSSDYAVLPESSLENGNKSGFGRAAPGHVIRPSMAKGESFASYRSSRSAGGRSLRKYQSYQSGMRRSGPDYGGTTSASDSPPVSKDHFDQTHSRMLRRRPGGDLRANENVHDLELRRPKSTGSITTYTDSMQGSMYLKRITTRNTPNQDLSIVADGQEPAAAERTVSLVSTRQSKADLRPSFEAAVAEFARIPDDEGGDLEATLAKLEGKFRKSPVGSREARPPIEGTTVVETGTLANNNRASGTPKSHVTEQELGSQEGSINGKDRKNVPGKVDASNVPRGMTAGSLYAPSEDSYNSTPLLERGLDKRLNQDGKTTSAQSNATMPQPLFSGTYPNLPRATKEQTEVSSDFAEEDGEGSDLGSYEANLRRGRYRSSMPTCTTDSFLLDEDEFLSDLSSELSDDPDAPNDALDEAYESSARLFHGSMFPTSAAYPAGYLPSPPMTTENAMAITSEANRMQEQRKPPTPEPSPVSRTTESGKSRTPGQVDLSVLQPFANTVHQFPTRRHIPFTLAFDAAILAQQFTIIERDALNEINWQDLIDMRWSSSKTETLNWVEYLHYGDPTGIELVTARFNIIVKWALSEIVLTHNIEERALTIIKFIDVAHHARKYRNYATMLQLTIALTSVDCTRLTKTWDLVPAAEKALLKEMETLVSPLRNFHNLRQEMETANLENGCIPVVALYIHDLTYNAQKPSVIASTRDGEPLINFERYRTTATIVKSLLRLIDASAKYDFKPVEGAIERCLWMASLSDDMIRIKSRELEADAPR